VTKILGGNSILFFTDKGQEFIVLSLHIQMILV